MNASASSAAIASQSIVGYVGRRSRTSNHPRRVVIPFVGVRADAIEGGLTPLRARAVCRAYAPFPAPAALAREWTFQARASENERPTTSRTPRNSVTSVKQV